MNRIKSITNPLMWFMALLLVGLVAGCGGSSGSSPAPLIPPPPPGGSGLAAVDLLTAGNFAILAESAITCNTSCTAATSAVPAVTGDVALSGVASYITGFTGMSKDLTNTFWTAPQVAGKLYATDNLSPTPATVTKASTDMVTAYKDALNRPAGTGKFLNAGATGEIGGLTLAPGVYTWTGNVTIASDVTLGSPTATATDVWIFQIPGTLTQTTGSVVLGGSAKAKNIFWQVSGSGVTLGAAPVIMQGVILSKTLITSGTGITVNGRLLAQTAVTLGGAVTPPAP